MKKTNAVLVVALLAAPATAAMPAIVATPANAAAPVIAAAPAIAVVPAAPSVVTALAAQGDIHGPYSMTASQCAVCHRSHTAKSANLVVAQAAPQSTLCFTCHDGTGAPDVKTAFTSLRIPANNPATREYYGHEVLTATAHRGGTVDEFGGVSNRHSECGDCHNPHQATDVAAAPTTTGWTASGAVRGVSGVSVVNGAAGTPPTYVFLNGVSTPVTAEYQLCFKCHSGFTTLPSNAGLTPSRYELDKGVEFNPNNPSFHPVEAPGTNRTAAMAESLAGPSPYKLWTFTPTSTIRCVNCHADDTVSTVANPAMAGDTAPSHRSANRGILLRNYRDRVLKSSGEPYAAADFALCYLCHAEAPFVGGNSTATNFRLHSKHVSGLGGEGSGGVDIDTAGAGQGNALCAECHYRIHSVSYLTGTQTVSGTRLLNFAPSVIANNGVLSWTPGTTSGGTCTLVCHGERHDGERY